MLILEKEINFRSFLFSALFLSFLVGCSGMEQAEEEKMKRLRARGEFIHRQHDDKQYAIVTPQPYVRDSYSWEETLSGKHPRITKEYFRCKGSSLNPPHLNPIDPKESATFDCAGFQRHSLSIREEKECVYPILLDLLNFVQERTGHLVVVTCGYRCPVHNTYADPSKANRSSKHQLGAEVDFYVQGMESNPEEIVKIVMDYYKSDEKAYREFERLNSDSWNVSTQPWSNKEVVIKLYQKHEGRDLDNRHPYSYLGIQVRFDRERQERVIYNWNTAFKGYQRF